MGNVFTDLIAGAEALTQKANDYMEGKEFLPNDVVKERIWKAALKLFEQHGGKYDEEDHLLFADLDWDALPWWAAQTLDGWMPFSQVPRNGSLGFSLGFSPASLDAHLRNILEIAEGRESVELDFGIAAKIKKADAA